MATRSDHTLSHARLESSDSSPARGVVCHLIASGFAGGPEKQIVELSARLSGLGWTVIVGSFRENRPAVEIIENAKARGLTTFLIDTRSPFSPISIAQLIRFLRRFEVDILVTHGYKPNVLGFLASRRLRVIQLPIVRGYTAEDWKVRVYEAIDRWLLRRFPNVLCVSQATKQLLAGYGLKKHRVHVVHNAVDCDQDIRPIDLSQEFRLPQGSRVLVAAGRLSPEKGHRYLVDALRYLTDHSPPIYLVILGSGKEQSRLQQQIAETDLTDRVVLGGFRSDILRYLAGADLVVNPSLSEGLPNVVLEALSVKTPVVATDVGGVGEMILPGETGWLVPSANARSLADAIVMVLSDDCRVREVAENGYRLVSGSFSFSHQAEHFADLCADMLRSSRGASDGRGALPIGDQSTRRVLRQRIEGNS